VQEVDAAAEAEKMEGDSRSFGSSCLETGISERLPFDEASSLVRTETCSR
jgi:hypothetical protein